MMKRKRPPKGQRLIDIVRSSTRIEYEVGGDGREFGFDDVKRFMRDALHAEPRRLAEHKDDASREAVLRRMLQDERPKRGLTFIDGKPGHYRYPVNKRKENAVLDRSGSSTVNQPKPKVAAYKRAPIRIEWIHPSNLFVDREVLVNARVPENRKGWLHKIGVEFDWNKFPLPIVSHRGGGKYAILDGGGSVYVITQVRTEFADLLIPCHVVDENVTTRADEAEVFRGVNKYRKRVLGVDYYVNDLVRGNPEAITIRDTLASIGLETPSTQERKTPKWPNGFTNVPMLRALVREGDLERTMRICRNAWRHLKKSPDGVAFTAVGAILRAYPRVDEDRLEKVLAQHDPEGLIIELKSKRGKLHPYMKATAIAHKYVDMYDKHARGKLIGGSRNADGRYRAASRVELENAASALISTWKLSSK